MVIPTYKHTILTRRYITSNTTRSLDFCLWTLFSFLLPRSWSHFHVSAVSANTLIESNNGGGGGGQSKSIFLIRGIINYVGTGMTFAWKLQAYSALNNDNEAQKQKKMKIIIKIIGNSIIIIHVIVITNNYLYKILWKLLFFTNKNI